MAVDGLVLDEFELTPSMKLDDWDEEHRQIVKDSEGHDVFPSPKLDDYKIFSVYINPKIDYSHGEGCRNEHGTHVHVREKGKKKEYIWDYETMSFDTKKGLSPQRSLRKYFEVNGNLVQGISRDYHKTKVLDRSAVKALRKKKGKIPRTKHQKYYDKVMGKFG